jgi:lipopolysaccharide transport system permease protein
MAGTIIWTYFATCLENITRTFMANMNLLSKVYFHRLAIPMSLTLSNLISFGIQFGIFLATLAIFIASGSTVRPTLWVLAMPLILIMLAGYGLGLGLILCAVTTRFRDLVYLVTFGIQLFMYLTPVIYPLSAVPARFRWFAELNPLTPWFEAFRLGFLGVGTVHAASLLYSAVVMVVVLVIGLALFSRAEQTVVDTI